MKNTLRSMMLCAKCSSIIFRRRDALPAEQLRLLEGLRLMSDYVFYLHHKNKLDLNQSQKTCHFCRKLWMGFHRCEKPFVDGKPIMLRIFLRDEWIQEGSVDQHISSDFLFASCHETDILADYAHNLSEYSQKALAVLAQDTSEATSEIIYSEQMDINTISDANIGLAADWQQQCVNNHLQCREITSKGGTLPYRVINISDIRNIRLELGNGRKALYAALSYKWGHATRYVMKSTNLANLEKDIPLKDVPKTFEDAILLAINLGYDFLWIDALCIMQDNQPELQEQIRVMGGIYSGSALTIYAAAGDSVDAGLNLPREVAVKKPTKLRFCAQLEDWAFEKDVYVREFEHYNNQKGPLPLLDRAWVLQEEILAPRALVVRQEEIGWRCFAGEVSESKPGFGAGHALDRGDTFRGLRSCLQDVHALDDEIQYPNTNKRISMFDMWYKMVEQYSQRVLSNHNDALDALQGISVLLSQMYGFHQAGGLWMEDIRLGLLWQAKSKKFYFEQGAVATLVHGPITSFDASPRMPQMQRLFRSSSWFALESLVKPNFQMSSYWGSPTWVKAQIRVDSYDGRVLAVSENTTPISIQICAPSWSWISLFGTGRYVEHQHDRRYVLDDEESLDLKGIYFMTIPGPNNVKTIAIKVKAYAFWARVSRIQTDEDDLELIDENTWDISAQALALIRPDCVGELHGGTRVLLVLVAMATVQCDDSHPYTMFTAMGVVPLEAVEGTYRRVGLVHVVDNKWFRQRIRTASKIEAVIV